jgi:hypothetical protein
LFLHWNVLYRWGINVVNIQIISALTKHHSKHMWKTASSANVLTNRFRVSITQQKNRKLVFCRSPHEFILHYHCISKIRSHMKLTSTRYSDTAFSIATLIFHFGPGIMMILRGYDKLQHFAQKSTIFTNPFHLEALGRWHFGFSIADFGLADQVASS